MNRLLLPALLLLAACANEPAASHQEEIAPEKTLNKSQELTYDSLLAAAYGADDYGMRSYVMAFLKKGPNRGLDSAAAMDLQRAHLNNIGRMAEAGQLVLAGPFMDDGELRGIYLFATSSIDSARIWTSTDPAIQAGSLRMEMHPWYGTAAIMALPELSQQVAKESF